MFFLRLNFFLIFTYFLKQNQANYVRNNVITTSSGEPISYKDASLSINDGSVLLSDTFLVEELAHFNRERVPERVVHAKGTGAFGVFEVTNNITEYCAASIFSEVGKKTKLVSRLSTGIGGSGSADTLRDLRGLAFKFYTEEGNWDLVALNVPPFLFRDAILFPSSVHTLKPDPVTHRTNWTSRWDFFTSRQEITHFLLYFFSDFGIPDGYRFMDGFAQNTFKLVNRFGQYVYCRFNILSNQGIKTLSNEEAQRLQVEQPDYALQDLYDAIEKKDYPSWTLYIQVLKEEEVTELPFNPFDSTKIWPQDKFPNIKVGRIVLNENLINHFAQNEQLSLSPANLVPGIEPAPKDKVLQGRLFAYTDSHRYRTGPNHLQLPINCPLSGFRNYQRDGHMAYNNQGNATNYHPNTIDNLVISERAAILSPKYYLKGYVERLDDGDDDNYSQGRYFYEEILDEGHKQRLASNIAGTITSISEDLQERVFQMFGKVSEKLENQMREQLSKSKSKK